MSMGGRPRVRRQPGLRAGTDIEVVDARVITRHYVQGTAVHSRSKGWIPMAKLDIWHVGAGGGPDQPEQHLELMMNVDEIDQLIEILTETRAASINDAIAGLIANDLN